MRFFAWLLCASLCGCYASFELDDAGHRIVPDGAASSPPTSSCGDGRHVHVTVSGAATCATETHVVDTLLAAVEPNAAVDGLRFTSTAGCVYDVGGIGTDLPSQLREVAATATVVDWSPTSFRATSACPSSATCAGALGISIGDGDPATILPVGSGLSITPGAPECTASSEDGCVTGVSHVHAQLLGWPAVEAATGETRSPSGWNLWLRTLHGYESRCDGVSAGWMVWWVSALA